MNISFAYRTWTEQQVHTKFCRKKIDPIKWKKRKILLKVMKSPPEKMSVELNLVSFYVHLSYQQKWWLSQVERFNHLIYHQFSRNCRSNMSIQCDRVRPTTTTMSKFSMPTGTWICSPNGLPISIGTMIALRCHSTLTRIKPSGNQRNSSSVIAMRELSCASSSIGSSQIKMERLNIQLKCQPSMNCWASFHHAVDTLKLSCCLCTSQKSFWRLLKLHCQRSSWGEDEIWLRARTY